MANAKETCGACGALIPAGLETCPACGALLAAYRQAGESAFAVKPVPPKPVPRPSTVRRPAAVIPVPEPVSASPVADVAPPVVDVPVPETPAAAASIPAPIAEEPPEEPEPQPAPAPPQARPPSQPPPTLPPVWAPPPPSFRAASPTPPPPPRRPGFAVKGSLQTALIAGVALFVVACVLGFIASAAGSDTLAGLGFCLSGLGVIVIIVALLLAAIRRERPRI